MVGRALRTLLFAAVSLPCAVPRRADAREDAPEYGALVGHWLDSRRPAGLSDFAVASDGRAWLFPDLRQDTVMLWQDGRRAVPCPFSPDGRFTRVAQVGRDRWLVLSVASAGKVRLYDFDGRRLTLEAEAEGEFLSPSPRVAHDGTVWIVSRNGKAVGVRGEERLVHEFGSDVKRQQYDVPLVLKVPGRGTWFWWHVEHQRFSTIEGFHVWRDGEWTTVPSPGGKLGGAVLGPEGKIVCAGRAGGVWALEPGDGSAVQLDWDLPADECVVFLHRTRTGKMLAVTAGPPTSGRGPPVKGGWCGSLFVVEEGRTRVLLDGVDLGEAQHWSGRPAVETDEGTYIAAVGAGLVFVPADGSEARRFDWRHGLPFADVTGIYAAGEKLYLLNEFRGLAVLDRRKLQQGLEVPDADRWDVHITATEARLGSDGLARCVSAADPPELLRFVWKSGEGIPLTGSDLAAAAVSQLAIDTKGRPWLFGRPATGRTAFLDGGRWRSFDRRSTAYGTVADEERGNEGFGVGWPSDEMFPAFCGDGRVAYMDEREHVHEYDGVEWRRRGDRFSVFELEGPPFYRDGVLTAKLTDAVRQWRDGSWVKGPDDAASPYGDEPVFHWKRKPPAGYPGNPDRCVIKLRDNTGAFWTGTPDELYRCVGDAWVRFGTLGTPLGMGMLNTSWKLQPIAYVLVDARGSIWFGLQSREHRRVARYYPPGARPVVEWSDAPPRETWRGVLRLRVKCPGDQRIAHVEYRLDGAPPRRAREEGGAYTILLEGLDNGTHECVVRACDGLLRTSPPLSHTFTVERDYDREVSAELPRLMGSADNREREGAARALAGIGRPALPYLREALETADEDDSWWLRAVIDGIKREIERGTEE
jgi:hypothetical protein